MSEPVTLEDIYQLFRASAEEFDRRLRESDLRRAEMERIFAEAKLESDRRSAEAERSMAELKRTVERTSKAVDSLTTRWGRFVEELVEPAVLR
nr:DUF3782 domain-containing protein [Microcystis aeruginosa BS13-02]